MAIGVAAVAFLVMPALASAVDITVNDDATGPGPAGATCAAAAHTTIPAAIAAASPGDRILVCAGTYTQPQVLLDKSIDLIGAGPGLSIIDGGNATNMPSTGLIRTANTIDGDVLVQGFTVRNAGQQGVGGSTPRYSIVLKGDDPGATQDFNRLEVIGLGAGGRDYGLDADNPDPDVILRNSSITDTDFNPILIEQVDGAVTIRDNVISQNGTTSTSSIFVVNYSNDPTINPVRIIGNSVDANGRSGLSVQSAFPGAGINTPGGYNAVEVRDNSVEDLGGTGLALLNGSPASGVPGEVANVDVAGNEFSKREGSVVAITGVRVQGRIRNLNVRGNTLTGLTNAITFANATAGHGAQGVTVRFNRIAGNSTAGLASTIAEPIDAEHNWWGCNEGPGQPGCDAVTGTVDFDPWLVLGLDATPQTIAAGGETSNLLADLTTDSAGDVAGPGFPEGTPIAFATSLGAVGTPVGTALGVAPSTLTSGDASGIATVSAALDGESVTTQVTFTALPPDTLPDEPTPVTPVTPIDPYVQAEAAKLRLSLRPRGKRVDAGSTVRYAATIRNRGKRAAADVTLCIGVPKNGVKVVGESCGTAGSLAAGARFKQKFELTTKQVSSRRRYRIRFKARSSDAQGRRGSVGLRVRP